MRKKLLAGSRHWNTHHQLVCLVCHSLPCIDFSTLSSRFSVESRSVVVVRNRESLVKTPAKRRPVFTSNSRNSWSYTETENLIKGVNAVGVGKWATILAQYEFDVSRTATSLKDKWRNIQGRRH